MLCITVIYRCFTATFSCTIHSVRLPIITGCAVVDDLCALCKPGSNLYRPIIVYADDILLLAPTVTALEKLLHACKRELIWLDMLINSKKSFFACWSTV